jgi:magnesium-transporting ATPase (P-type)
MNDANNDYTKITNKIRKIARIWSVVIIALVFIIFILEIIGEFFEDQSISEPYPWYENLQPLSLFLSVFSLAIAWRWEGLGSVLSIFFVLATYGMYVAFGGSGRGLYTLPLILTPILIPGILFLISWLRTERGTKPSSA